MGLSACDTWRKFQRPKNEMGGKFGKENAGPFVGVMMWVGECNWHLWKGVKGPFCWNLCGWGLGSPAFPRDLLRQRKVTMSNRKTRKEGWKIMKADTSNHHHHLLRWHQELDTLPSNDWVNKRYAPRSFCIHVYIFNSHVYKYIKLRIELWVEEDFASFHTCFQQRMWGFFKIMVSSLKWPLCVSIIIHSLPLLIFLFLIWVYAYCNHDRVFFISQKLWSHILL